MIVNVFGSTTIVSEGFIDQVFKNSSLFLDQSWMPLQILKSAISHCITYLKIFGRVLVLDVSYEAKISCSI